MQPFSATHIAWWCDMNFLELCKVLRREIGYSGSGPVAVTGQTGQSQREVAWTEDAWLAIQRDRPNWRFMAVEFSQPFTAGAALVALGSDARALNKNTLVSFRADGQRSFPEVVEIEALQALRRENPTVTGALSIAALDGGGNVQLYPTPQFDGTIHGTYQRRPVMITDNLDEPAMPEEYHMAIVWRALMTGAAYEGAQNLYLSAQANYIELMNRLTQDQLPQMKMPGPLA